MYIVYNIYLCFPYSLTMKYFFSVDWGTSSLRVRLVSINDNSINICHEVTNSFGCAAIYESFKNEKEGTSREDYFLGFLRPYLLIPDSVSPQGSVPVVISGMATSSIGIREIPYSPLPFTLDGSSLRHETIRCSEKFDHNVLLLSGVCSEDDVMRGEEVQLLGLLHQQARDSEALFILPGTHSKHIHVKGNHIAFFKTYITGEMFQVLSTYSLLKNSITKAPSIDKDAFRKGLELSQGNILHDVFTIRALTLLDKAENSANYSLLSGLLIGTELRDIVHLDLPIFLCAHDNLMDSYILAIQELSMQKQCTVVPADQVDKSVIYGQKIILDKVWDELKTIG